MILQAIKHVLSMHFSRFRARRVWANEKQFFYIWRDLISRAQETVQPEAADSKRCRIEAVSFIEAAKF
eukprot:8065460-Pyramimonas_sp.AAC.1